MLQLACVGLTKGLIGAFSTPGVSVAQIINGTKNLLRLRGKDLCFLILITNCLTIQKKLLQQMPAASTVASLISLSSAHTHTHTHTHTHKHTHTFTFTLKNTSESNVPLSKQKFLV